MPDDLLHYYKEWDAKLVSAFRLFNKVHQPLSFLIEPAYRKKVVAVANGIESRDSIISCYYSEDESKMLIKEQLLNQYRYA